MAHLGPVGPRWAPCWPHGPCYQGTSGTKVLICYLEAHLLGWCVLTSFDTMKLETCIAAHGTWCLNCLLNPLFRCRSKKISKLYVTDLCEGNSPVTGEFPTQKANNTEKVSIWWRHYARTLWRGQHIAVLLCIQDKLVNLIMAKQYHDIPSSAAGMGSLFYNYGYRATIHWMLLTC